MFSVSVILFVINIFRIVYKLISTIRLFHGKRMISQVIINVKVSLFNVNNR